MSKPGRARLKSNRLRDQRLTPRHGRSDERPACCPTLCFIATLDFACDSGAGFRLSAQPAPARGVSNLSMKEEKDGDL